MANSCYTIIQPTFLGYRLLFGITTEWHSASARNRVHLPRNSHVLVAQCLGLKISEVMELQGK
jgi:hypothetical protein